VLSKEKQSWQDKVEYAMIKKHWWWLGLLVILVLAGCRGEGEDLDGVVVKLEVAPDPPHAGPATVTVTLSDADGRSIDGAAVKLEGNMNHAGMVPVMAEATEVSPGRYEASLEFTMGGDWFILVQATLADGRTLERQIDVPGVDASGGHAAL
jgi:hypothetical protein